MSRIGQSPIAIPEGVSVLLEGDNIKVNGSKGSLDFKANKDMVITESEGMIIVDRKVDNREQKSLHGTLIAVALICTL